MKLFTIIFMIFSLLSTALTANAHVSVESHHGHGGLHLHVETSATLNDTDGHHMHSDVDHGDHHNNHQHPLSIDDTTHAEAQATADSSHLAYDTHSSDDHDAEHVHINLLALSYVFDSSILKLSDCLQPSPHRQLVSLHHAPPVPPPTV
ncbi:Uncharacterised protein [BD1-7 clade bacterium]|uniref:Uncharacterized protein n=1 Tax=BD1-7 clade bacterium TaxID=2029982 RepID=A0A5S9N575_9GAMM|nr:Uncharacterised protein [BD1-7 clade bacterium]